MSIAGSVLSIFDWLKDKLPVPNRLEAIKNEIFKLEEEGKALTYGKADSKKSQRLVWIDNRLKLLNRRLQNATNSS
jgi:hypothetical protein